MPPAITVIHPDWLTSAGRKRSWPPGEKLLPETGADGFCFSSMILVLKNKIFLQLEYYNKKCLEMQEVK
ncbi:MAG: hypothetical protein KJ620_02995 [Candidatus Edwardsbacteria bacterium]|nr:hypothetical protein [Candidatus Edwardsbacteria bacterium]MBU1577393.1 hypothetical protein [Candidatus Edwardsbacteria bacterium]MBU2463949.1 hypothetical protein [Candidatus Edwardsbacteria bacterium]MBU2593497.1 hypothetical protein [Candidatus Edwardsbacteria bacterium]